MNDKFFATIKLMTGEEIVGLVEVHEEGLVIQNPLILEDMSDLQDLLGDDIKVSGLRLSKWIKSTTDNIFFITDTKIVTVNELLEPGLTHYKKAVTQINETFKKKISKAEDKKKYNGYRASVEHAREFFEDLFNSY
jgi:hypothetical protein|tara:strand:- start:333 stop:740 length:408 start_codon:yes stop_codon:yes gene_type:complete